MALLVVEVGDRPDAVRVDLSLLTADRGIAAVADVPPGPHHVSVLRHDGWQHGWVFVDGDDEHVAVGPAGSPPGDVATDAVVALPTDAGGWTTLASHLVTRDAVFDDFDVEDAIEDDWSGSTRFERLLDALDGDGTRVLAALQRTFLEWTLPPDGLDPAAGQRWLRLLGAVTGAGPRGVAAEPALLADAVDVLTTQLGALPPDVVDESVRDALADLRDDLADAR